MLFICLQGLVLNFVRPRCGLVHCSSSGVVSLSLCYFVTELTQCHSCKLHCFSCSYPVYFITLCTRIVCSGSVLLLDTSICMRRLRKKFPCSLLEVAKISAVYFIRALVIIRCLVGPRLVVAILLEFLAVTVYQYGGQGSCIGISR